MGFMVWEYVFILNKIEICWYEKVVSEYKDVGKISNICIGLVLGLWVMEV